AGRMKEEGGPADLLDRIAGDEAFNMVLTELQQIADSAQFVGRAPQQVDRFLAEWVQPALERLQSDANKHLGEPDVRV
ncbi:uncharacterized protein METZ01_LOCUS264672, partial [marine metagenome]